MERCRRRAGASVGQKTEAGWCIAAMPACLLSGRALGGLRIEMGRRSNARQLPGWSGCVFAATSEPNSRSSDENSSTEGTTWGRCDLIRDLGCEWVPTGAAWVEHAETARDISILGGTEGTYPKYFPTHQAACPSAGLHCTPSSVPLFVQFVSA